MRVFLKKLIIACILINTVVFQIIPLNSSFAQSIPQAWLEDVKKASDAATLEREKSGLTSWQYFYRSWEQAVSPENLGENTILGKVAKLSQDAGKIAGEGGGWGEIAGSITKSLIEGSVTIFSKITTFLIENIIIPLANIIVVLSGKMLNYSIQYTIFQSLTSGDSTANPISTFDSSIKEIWTIVRDLFNVCFIFILLYISIRKILGLADGKIKGLLFSVIISALFINFSYFTSRIIIDIGNVITTSVYNQIEEESEKLDIRKDVATDSFMKGIFQEESTIKVSEMLRDSLGLQTIYSGDKKLSNFENETAGESLFRLIIYIITAFVFFSLTFLLIGRYVALIFLIASSPVGFLFGSIPGMDSYSKKWWNELIKQISIAPIFMFFMLMIIRVSQTDALKEMRTSEENIDVGAYFNYAIVISLMIASLKITKNLSGNIGSLSNKVSSFATGAALATVTGGTALIGRQVLGRGAAALAGSAAGRKLQEAGAKGGLIGGLSNLTLKGIKGTANSTFDVRNSKIAQEGFGQMKNISGGAVDIQGALNSVGSYGKTSGDYGKDKRGFTGWKDKKTEETLKSAQEYDKSSKDFEAKLKIKTVGERDRLVQEEKKAEQQWRDAENDYATASAADEVAKRTARDAARANYEAKKQERKDGSKGTIFEIDDRSEESFESIPVGDSRRRAYEEAEAKIQNIRINQATNKHDLETGNNGMNQQKYDKEEAKLQKELAEAIKEIDDAKVEGIKKQIDTISEEILQNNRPEDKLLTQVIKQRKMRKDYADQIKKQFLTLSTTNELNSLSDAIKSSKGESKEKSEEEKTLAALLKQIEKLNDKK